MAAFKFLLIIIIFIIPTIIGYIHGSSYKRRRENLDDFQYCIRLLQSEILVKSTPLPEALKDIYKRDKNGVYNVLSQIGEDLKDSKVDDIYLSFLSKKKLLKERYFFKEEDIEVFLYLGKILGQTNRMDQEKNLNFIISQVEQLSKQAIKEEEKSQKLYPALGVLTGFGMIIILL